QRRRFQQAGQEHEASKGQVKQTGSESAGSGGAAAPQGPGEMAVGRNKRRPVTRVRAWGRGSGDSCWARALNVILLCRTRLWLTRNHCMAAPVSRILQFVLCWSLLRPDASQTPPRI